MGGEGGRGWRSGEAAKKGRWRGNGEKHDWNECGRGGAERLERRGEWVGAKGWERSGECGGTENGKGWERREEGGGSGKAGRTGRVAGEEREMDAGIGGVG